MDSHWFLTLSVLFFFAISSPSVVVSASRVSSSSLTLPSGGSSEKVALGLYYESLCPYSADFIINYLAKIFENGLISIVDLHLAPWGNAKIRANNTVDCQHGPSECFLNTIEACAIDVWADVNTHFSFINCVETLVYDRKFPEWESCFEQLGLDRMPVDDCYSTGYGEELELQYAAETNALHPPHQYVPWVVVDGQPLYEDFENFMSYICKAYKGTAVPSACSGLALREENANTSSPVYHREEATESILSKIRSFVTSWARRVAIALWQ